MSDSLETTSRLERQINGGKWFPVDEAEALRSELFYQRAVHAYMTMQPALNVIGMRDGSEAVFGKGYNASGIRLDMMYPTDFAYWEKLKAFVDYELAICRGMQLLNVALGGTLVQHLGDGMHRDADPEIDMVTHAVAALPGTRVAAALGAGEHDVRSAHHQAVAELGEGLVVTATSSDGVIEAIELAGARWVVGVQWHPEDPGSDPRQLRALLRDFAASTAPAAPSAPSVAEPEAALSAASSHP